ncbi:BtpA/SgcQ family protein [Feifania hominis]|uniref:BtpA/SgcQ family protein n=1 Tax=Feifania hominis TaxID=2763660 RepID=A0A926DCP5_9FIRM|nr:BtpA/SgcQ family protein [Feifania hominis]MBC8535771.1 BtpA/SgcQ family protein [Feifania hominis]
MKTWLKDLFHVEKPIIALLHIREIPGDFNYDDSTMSMEKVIEIARQELHALQDGGVDGILFSNEYSFPYQGHTDYVTSQCMARLIGELMSEIKIPYGVNVISDNRAVIDLAKATDASFVRGTFTGAFVGEGGFSDHDVAATYRRKKELGIKNLPIMMNCNPESAVWLNDRDIYDVVKSMIFNCDPEGLCVSGQHAGFAANNDLLKAVKSVAGEVPVFANTGCNKDNIVEKMQIADAACVGTAFKKDGKFYNTVDGKRVKEFMDTLKEYRKTL